MCGTSENDDQVRPDDCNSTENCYFSRWQRAFQRSQAPLWVSSMSAKFYTQLLFLVLKNANNAKLDLDPLQGLCFVHGSLRNEIYELLYIFTGPPLDKSDFRVSISRNTIKTDFLVAFEKVMQTISSCVTYFLAKIP